MLLSTWYANWKEKRIQEAVEAAKAKGYEDGYADGKAGNPNRKGIGISMRQERARRVPREGKSHTDTEK